MSNPNDQSQYAPQSESAESVIQRPVWSILNKGFTGTGKTILSVGKEFRPVYVFDFEGRFDSILQYYMKLDGHVKDIFFNHFPLEEGFFKANAKMDAIVGRPEYKTIVVSSLTSFIRNILLHLQRASVGKTVDGRVKGIKSKGGIQVNILEDYNFEDSAIINELVAFFQILKSQGVNTILEAHITPYEIKTLNEETNEKELTTIMEILTKGKKAPAELPGWFNEVWLSKKIIKGGFQDKSVQYIVDTDGDSANSCKSSFGIKTFDWTGKDGSIELMSQLSNAFRETPMQNPNAPKRTGFSK